VIKPKKDVNKLSNYLFLVIFGIAFGFVEASVVYYLRSLINFHLNYDISNYKVLLNLGFMTFVNPVHSLLISSTVTHIETFREMATIIMLVAISFIAGKNKRQSIGAFLVSFACWDIMYYVFLKILDNWPSSLMTKDVFFLVPVTWIGPVLTPIVCSIIMFVVGSRLYLYSPKPHHT
jgi:hypothetical protein